MRSGSSATVILAVAMALLACLAGGRGVLAAEGFSDAAVGKAIQKGVKFLYAQQQGDGSWKDPGGGGLDILKNNRVDDRQVGGVGLNTYALLASGEKVGDPRIVKALEWLEKQNTMWTYGVSLRTQAYMEAAKHNTKYIRQLFLDARILIRVGGRGPKPLGSYGYRLDGAKDGFKNSDPSNGQYGVLGVWGAHQFRGEVPRQYWLAVMTYWRRMQQADGGWKYGGGDKHSSGTMTAAGLATMFVCIDALMYSQFSRCQRTEEVAVLKKALEWFDRNFPKTLSDENLCHGGHGGMYYYLFGVERVGLASGYRYFGKADWYRLGAQWLLSQQQGNGSWKGKYGETTSTAYALLFLSRGQKPILLNRLEYDGDWNNRPRALANLCRWSREAFEQDVNWQIVNLQVPVSDWHDAPVVVITGSEAPKFTDDHVRRLRRYVQEGGTILSITECDGKGFGEGIREAYKKIFPGRQLKELAPDHKLFTVHAQLKPGRLKLSVLSNGARPLVIHSDTDISLDWQMNRRITQKDAFDMAANIVMYVTGRQLRNRGADHWTKTGSGQTDKSVKLVRLKHDGNYDPEPLAWRRISRLVGARCKVHLEVGGPVAISELGGSGARIAALTGTTALKLSESDKAGLKKFVESGGLLLVDAAGGWLGGGREFAKTAEETIELMFGRGSLRTLASHSGLYKRKGYDIPRAHYHRITKLRLGVKEPRLKAVMVGQRIGVLVSREDLTVAMIGCRPAECDGYTPESAYEIARNIVLYAADGMK
jgi:hypothetical protein